MFRLLFKKKLTWQNPNEKNNYVFDLTMVVVVGSKLDRKASTT